MPLAHVSARPRAASSLLAVMVLACLAGGLAAAGLRADVGAEVVDVRPALPAIPDRTFVLTDFGAVGDGRTINTAAFKKAIAAVEKAGGGKLVVPHGVYRTLAFRLCSSLDLHLDQDAVIQAPDTFAAFGLPDPATLHSQAEVDSRFKAPDPLISGSNLHDVAITGAGTIDGNGALWWAWSERAARTKPGRVIIKRPHLVAIFGCHRLRIADITLINSSMFHLVPRDITDLTIERVTVRVTIPDLLAAPNTDAIDPGPVTRALIRNCTTDTGDDDICIKTGGSDILIEDCTILHGHGISIGSPTTLGIHDMLVRHCTFEGTDNGIRIKSMRGAGGPITGLRYTYLQMKDVENAIVLDLSYTDSNRPNFSGNPSKIPSIHGVLFDHIVVENAKNAGKFSGLPDSRITGITFQNVEISAHKDFVYKYADRPVSEESKIEILP